MPDVNSTFYHLLEEHLTPEYAKSKAMIIREGKRSGKFYYLKKGILRGWTLHEGKEVTFQFLFENHFFCSMESFWYNKQSLYSVQAIEDVELLAIDKQKTMELLAQKPALLATFNEYLMNRLLTYQKMLIDRIKDKPEKRYQELLDRAPEIFRRVPQHYIASYLGITSVSLSRIRNRR
ncbi:cAMP-binding domain of CRP or a regulatory subunit of cAMP-dependent protein kinases [Sinomicrobium oceani]|uniref:cAMP-binding domain of CRP or a regulatory subunit of cAMP-dependent protein kinases n=1 Tax=Sinomicrobium oceani TaxID=1150368 RepID=A0A1K1R3U8_9FLAO|nr:Crp/Fnr family transcriptional regulator [Sinomicrobium oceani]SFW66262.1 cAMP-binding domain of CRP or a regulatory subunit of cAMP-dependent protein kinases [Sinomicrobium oceani]